MTQDTQPQPPQPPDEISGEPRVTSQQLDLILAVAMGTADEAEITLVEQMTATSPQARLVLEEYRAIGDAFITRVEPMAPPLQLRNSLMARIAASPRSTGGATAGARTGEPIQPLPLPTDSTSPATSHVVAMPQGQPVVPSEADMPVPTLRTDHVRRSVTPSWWFSAAAVLVLVISNVLWAMQSDRVSRSLADAQSASAAAEAQVDQVLGLLLGDNTDQISLVSSEASATQVALLLWNSDSNQAALYTQGLPMLPTGETYQLWLIDGETPVSAGIFAADDTADALTFQPRAPLDQYQQFAISIEPQGGSNAPTTTPIASGTARRA